MTMVNKSWHELAGVTVYGKRKHGQELARVSVCGKRTQRVAVEKHVCRNHGDQTPSQLIPSMSRGCLHCYCVCGFCTATASADIPCLK